MDEWTDDGWTERWMGELIDEWKDGRMDEKIDELMVG